MNERNEPDTADEAFVERAKRRFDESVEQMDAATLSRLNRRRHRALEAAGGGFETLPAWVPVTGIAVAAALAVLVVVRDPAVDEVAAPAPATVMDIEILLDEDSFEMLEDLEFYSWIDTDPAFLDALEIGANVG
jgi:hypothetical protein